MYKLIVTTAMALSLALAPRAQDRSPGGAARAGWEQILDVDVRDGMVYYRALKQERGTLDAYVTALAGVSLGSASRDEQLAFWLNAYNAFVLRTVIDNYPIARRSPDYPAQSIRQIPGAFERLPHTAAGRTVTLDQIEQTILPGFHDPRVYFALGRGAVDGGRLRSEPFTAERLETQLTGVASECATRLQCVQVDRTGDRVLASAIFSWREREFTAAWAGAASATFANRSPAERAILAFVEPGLLTSEREFLATNQFQVKYQPFDWTLNDLTGRGGR